MTKSLSAKLSTLAILLFLLPPFALAHPGWGLVVNQHGHVYFTDLERVWKIDADGRVSVFVKDVHTHDLYLDDEDTLYGEHEWYEQNTDTFHIRYWKATPDGHVSDISEEEAGRFFDRWDAQGNRYSLFNDRQKAVVTKTTPEGESRLLAGGPFGYADGPGHQARFRLFGTSAWGPDQCLYVTNGGLIRKITPDATVSTVVGPDQGFSHSVQANGNPRYSALLGLAVAHDGAIFFADIDQKKVFNITPDGTLKCWSPACCGYPPASPSSATKSTSSNTVATSRARRTGSAKAARASARSRRMAL